MASASLPHTETRNQIVSQARFPLALVNLRRVAAGNRATGIPPAARSRMGSFWALCAGRGDILYLLYARLIGCGFLF